MVQLRYSQTNYPFNAIEDSNYAINIFGRRSIPFSSPLRNCEIDENFDKASHCSRNVNVIVSRVFGITLR